MHPLSSSAPRLPFASALLSAPSHWAVSGCSGPTAVAALGGGWEAGVGEWGAHNTPPRILIILPSLPGDSHEVANRDVCGGAHSWHDSQMVVIHTPTRPWKAGLPREERTKQDKKLCPSALPWIKVYGVNARRAGMCRLHA